MKTFLNCPYCKRKIEIFINEEPKLQQNPHDKAVKHLISLKKENARLTKENQELRKNSIHNP